MPPPGYPQYQRQAPTEGMAIASLVAGIVGFFICPIIGAPLAVIFGYIAKRNIKDSGGTLSGETFATAGIILGFIQLGLILVGLVIWIIIAITASTTNNGMVLPGLLVPLVLL